MAAAGGREPRAVRTWSFCGLVVPLPCRLTVWAVAAPHSASRVEVERIIVLELPTRPKVL
jgi:hypothetical protein